MNRRITAAAVAAIVPTIALIALGADHRDAPGSTADLAADITDLYVWHDAGANRLTTVIGFAGLRPPVADQAGTYDEEVLYTLNIDRDGDEMADVAVRIRFGQSADGDWGIQVADLPGADGTVVGPVETVIDGGGGTRVYAGLRDDPFFFDLDGFRSTVMTGTLSFDNDRDTFAGTNITAIVLRMPLSAATGGSATTLRLWTTAGRLTAPIGVAALPDANQPVIARRTP